MLIGELVKQSGLSKDTIRFYEKEGLLTDANIQRSENGYKSYASEALSQLNVIRDLKELGFTLSEIKGVMRIYAQNNHLCSDNLPLIESKIQTIRLRIKKLKLLEARLASTASNCIGDCSSGCEIKVALQTR